MQATTFNFELQADELLDGVRLSIATLDLVYDLQFLPKMPRNGPTVLLADSRWFFSITQLLGI